MAEKAKSQQKRKFHCACAIGDLSAVQPETAAATGDAKPDASEASRAPAAVGALPGADQPQTRKSRA
jgi:hypothetical protein